MLNGLKGMFDPNRKNDDDPKPMKRAIVIIVAVVVLALIRFGVSFFTGSAEEQQSTIEFVRNNFHINIVDVVLCITALIIYLILKSKNNKE